jgi:LmbE family N-acetylglucosaminyl deacetylase
MSHRIVCIHAHPDDAEIFAGGTLALLRARGHDVAIVTLAAGDCGSAEYGAEEISRIRRGEAARAAGLIGAQHVMGGFSDLAIFVDDPSRRRVTAILRRLRPDIVITASPVDYHCDHEATSRLVTDACFGVSAPNYDTSAFDPAPALDRIPHLYFTDPAEGLDRGGRTILPQFVADVAATFEIKRAMLAEHDSQRSWLRKQHGMDDYLATMEQWTRARGALAGLTYGEGFRQYTGHPYPRTPLLQQLLSGVAVDLPAA